MRRIIFALIVVLFVLGCKGEITGEVAKSVEEPAAVAESCEDTDNGVDSGTKGAVSGIENGDQYENEDTCISGLLIEYYCEGNKSLNQNIRCPDKCSDGACV